VEVSSPNQILTKHEPSLSLPSDGGGVFFGVFDGRNADKICVIEGGKVVESGPHDELIHINGGKYLQLVKLQLGGAINADGCVRRSKYIQLMFLPLC